jgi:DNA primase
MSELLLDLVTDILGEPKSQYGKGGQYQFNCPICSAEKGKRSDGKYNLEVNIEKNVYNCWSCTDNHGSLKKLVGLWGNKEQKKRVKILLPEEVLTDEGEEKELFDGLPKEYIYLKSNYQSRTKEKAIDYLKKRGLTDYHIEKYKLGYAEKGKYKGRIIIPSYDSADNINFFTSRTFTNQKPKYLNPKIEKSDIIFNEKLLSWYSTIYFVEGPFDHLVVPNSIPGLGKIMSDDVLKKITDNALSNIVILQDGDAWKDSVELYKKLNQGKFRDRVSIIKLPEKYDISKINEVFGNDGIVKILRSSFKLRDHLI